MIDVQQQIAIAATEPEYRWWVAGVFVPFAGIFMAWWLNRRRRK